MLRSDGRAFIYNHNGYRDAVAAEATGLFPAPPLPAGLTYTQVAAGHPGMLLLRSDGQV